MAGGDDQRPQGGPLRSAGDEGRRDRTEPRSDSHRLVVLRQDNGELQEDVVVRELADHDRLTSDRLDETIAASFPASDPSPAWSGPDRASSPTGRDHPSSRVVSSAPVEQTSDRPDPAAPIPRTIPRQTSS